MRGEICGLTMGRDTIVLYSCTYTNIYGYICQYIKYKNVKIFWCITGGSILGKKDVYYVQ